MDKFLTGKTAIVTGGTRGIGRKIAEALVDAGARVAICGRDAGTVRQAVSELNSRGGGEATGEAADIAQWDEVARFFESVGAQFGGLDVLINNAGIGVFRPVGQLTVEDWQRTIGLNLSGVFYCCTAALPLMKQRGGGYIIQISSLAGRNTFPGGAAYNASKFGLNGFSEAMMQDIRYDDVRVSEIMPGSVATGFTAAGAAEEEWRIAPEDIAEVVLSLLRMPVRTLVSRVEMRPSKPRKG
ncbi:MAG: SDR family oxidoreductase [Bryobacterales bacterium]|nr:SDR family oxidoreductase [Bryobacterales bacterium]